MKKFAGLIIFLFVVFAVFSSCKFKHPIVYEGIVIEKQFVPSQGGMGLGVSASGELAAAFFMDFFDRLGYKLVEYRDFGESVPAAAGSAVGIEFRIVPKEPKKD